MTSPAPAAPLACHATDRTVLLMQQNDRQSGAIADFLMRAGYEVHRVPCASSGVRAACARTYAVAVIALDTACDVVRDLRKLGQAVPAVAVADRHVPEHAVRFLELGGDDYLSEPFVPAELVARVGALLRRGSACPAGGATGVVTVGDLSVDLVRRAASLAGQPVHTTNMEYAILELLAQHVGQLVHKSTVLLTLYGSLDVHPRSADVAVCKLRRKLRRIAEDSTYIHTDWGRGYRLQHTTKAGEP